MEKIEIPLSRTKLFLGIAGSLAFVLVSFYLFDTLADYQVRFSPVLIKGIGIIGMLFFASTGIYGIKKLFEKSIGLTIDEEGIYDNTNASSIGLIKWSDITDIKTKDIASTKFLLIYVSDPDFYISKAKGFRRKLMQSNNKMYGTPLSITSSTLKCSFEKLEKQLYEAYRRYVNL